MSFYCEEGKKETSNSILNIYKSTSSLSTVVPFTLLTGFSFPDFCEFDSIVNLQCVL